MVLSSLPAIKDVRTFAMKKGSRFYETVLSCRNENKKVFVF